MAKAGATRKKCTKAGAKHKLGRPRTTHLDVTKIHDLVLDGCSNRDIALLLDTNEATLKQHYQPVLAKSRAERRQKLSAKQWQIAMQRGGAGTTMAIFLGKNELSQTDKAAVEHTGGLSVKVSITADKGADKK